MVLRAAAGRGSRLSKHEEAAAGELAGLFGLGMGGWKGWS